MRLRYCPLLIIALLSVSLPVQASPWYPIETGHLWSYSQTGGEPVSAIVDPPETFAGVFAQPVHWNNGVIEYLTQDTAGRVFLHGMIHPDGSFLFFEPPILRMDPDLTVGHEWEATYEVIHYNADDVEVARQQGRSTFHVLDIRPVTVPAGTFLAAEVLRTEQTDPPTDSGVSSGSSPVSPDQVGFTAFRDMYAEGIGWIRRTNEDGTWVFYRLQTFGVDGVPAQASSWGAVKSKFGN